MTYDGVTYYYITNPMGDVTGIANESGIQLVYYYYTAYGIAYVSYNTAYQALGATLSGVNPLFYRGYVYDQETGLYYLQSRYYNPKLGRFINADALVSTGQGLLGNNMFAYCLNNPVNHHDQNGMFPLEVAMELFERWLQGDESDELYDSNSIVAQRIKESETMMAIVEDAIIKYENGEEYRTGTVIFDSSEPDLWLGVRRASYEITIHKKTWAFRSLQGTIIITEYTVSVKIIDKYNFNIGNEKGDGLGSILNNAGYYMHYYGIGKNYWWEAQFEYVKYRFTH